MAILYKLVFLTACPGTHHKLAMDALRHLRCPDADRWRDIFLNYYEPYLEGAKAPDNEFKDFQNHVLHVRENYWGGAIRTAQLWYERLVKALRREYWSDAVYTAGVLSHYFTDPMMPFHTGQTEEEGKVHRAAEWSISKCYLEFQNILEQDLGGYPNVLVPSGDDWLSRLMKEGAELANTHYEPLLDHYDLVVGVQDPPAGLDQECKDRVAQMIGFAAVGFARVLEKAFVEAGSAPPMCELVTETVLATLKVPGRWLLARMDDEDEREELEELLAEVEQTGKVVENLRDDDKFVRKLHAHQVLKVPLKELDEQPAKPTGMHYGTGKADRNRAPGFLERWFGWDLSLFDWEDDDTPQFVAPIPIRKQGVGLGMSGVGRAASLASTGATGARGATPTVRGESGRAEGGRTARRRRRFPARSSDGWREPSGKLDTNEAGPLDSPTGDRLNALDQTSDAGSSDAREERRDRESLTPPAKRSWFAWGKRKAASKDEDQETESTVDSSNAERVADDGDQEPVARNKRDRDPSDTENRSDANGPTRSARLKQAVQGVAKKVWSGTTNAAGKMKRFVPKFKPKSANDSSANEGRGEPGERQGLLGDEQDAEAANSRETSSRTKGLKFHLQTDSVVEDAPSIGPKMARRLESFGVRTIADLLEADADEIARRLAQKQVDGDVVRQWQQQSELMCRIPEVRGHDVQILVACGVTDPAELAAMDPATLFELIEPFLGTREAESILRGSPAPDLNEVADWIDWAQHARPQRAA